MLARRAQGRAAAQHRARFDSCRCAQWRRSLGKAQMVVTLSPFKANMDISDVLLPIAPFTETSGTFVNAEGRVQGFHAVVKPLGETRPAWKVLRVLANLMGCRVLISSRRKTCWRPGAGRAGPGQPHGGRRHAGQHDQGRDQPGCPGAAPVRHPSTSWTASCAAHRRCSDRGCAMQPWV
jgi:hypothetical protein